jgi:hypothetical protein
MKAKFIHAKDSAELSLENGKIFRAKRGEDADSFYSRIAGLIDEQYMEPLAISEEIKQEHFAVLSEQQLRARLEEATPLENEIITGLLAPEEDSQSRGSGNLKLSFEEAEQLWEDSKQHKGKSVSFAPKNAGGEMLEGEIRGLQFDKRVPAVYFRIIVPGHEKPYHKKVGSDKLTVLDD